MKDRNFSHLKTWLNQLKRRHIYNLSKICPLAVWKRQNCPSGRPLGRPANGHFYDRWATGRPPDRPRLGYREQSSLPDGRPIDWGQIQRAELCGSRPGRSTGLPA